MDVVDETQDAVDVLDPVDGLPGVPKPCAQVQILPGALAELLVRTVRGSGVTRGSVAIPSFIPSFGSRFDGRAPVAVSARASRSGGTDSGAAQCANRLSPWRAASTTLRIHFLTSGALSTMML